MSKIIIVDPNDKFTNDLKYAGYGNKSLADELHKAFTRGELARHVKVGSDEFALLSEVWSRLKSQG